MFKKFIEKLYLKMEDNLVYVDSLTSVKTRRYYDDVVVKRYKSKKCAVIFIDIDFLKEINDAHGHKSGDEFIQKISTELLKLKNIYEICRISGDEFVIIADTNFNTKDLDEIPGITYGYNYKDPYQSVEYAVKRADEFMYKHKRKKHKRK